MRHGCVSNTPFPSLLAADSVGIVVSWRVSAILIGWIVGGKKHHPVAFVSEKGVEHYKLRKLSKKSSR